MDRKTAITTAAAAAFTLLAGSAALAANVGILGGADDPTVGELSPVAFEIEDTTSTSTATATTAPEIETIYVDEYVQVPGGTTPGTAGTPGSVAVTGDTTPGSTPGSTPDSTPTSTPDSTPTSIDDHGGASDDSYDDSEIEDEDEHEEEHESEDEHEYEGADDDD